MTKSTDIKSDYELTKKQAALIKEVLERLEKLEGEKAERSELCQDPKGIEWKAGYPWRDPVHLDSAGIIHNLCSTIEARWVIDTVTPSKLRWIPHLTRSIPLDEDVRVIIKEKGGSVFTGEACEFIWDPEHNDQGDDCLVVAYAIIENPSPEWLK